MRVEFIILDHVLTIFPPFLGKCLIYSSVWTNSSEPCYAKIIQAYIIILSWILEEKHPTSLY